MCERELTVQNRAGLHTRPAAHLVKLASRFRSEIFLVKEGAAINAKSIIGVMTLAAEQGAQLLLRAEGDDEREAADAIVEFFDARFGEES